MSLLYSQLDEMESSLDNLQAEVSDMAETEEMFSAADDQPVTWHHIVTVICHIISCVK